MPTESKQFGRAWKKGSKARQKPPEARQKPETEGRHMYEGRRAAGRRQAGKTAGRAARRQAGRAQQSYRPGKKVTDPALDRRAFASTL